MKQLYILTYFIDFARFTQISFWQENIIKTNITPIVLYIILWAVCFILNHLLNAKDYFYVEIIYIYQ